ncbi:MAG: hypothetical protein JWM57_295, partial [Phycisphaerales bacterium]|nr:hypothetical protein [Phycisphaerales bacterium]
KIGQGVGVVAGEVTRLTDALTDIADKLNHPEKVVGSLGNYAIRRTGQYVLNSDVGGMTDAAGDTLSRLDAALFGGDKPAPVAKVIQSAPPVADSRRWGAFSDLVASLDGKDNGLPAFGPTLLAGISTAGRLNDLTRDQVDKLTEISGAGRGAFASSGEVTGRLQEQFLKAIDAFDNGLAEGERRLKAATDPQEAAQLRGLIQSTNDVRSKLISAYNTAGQTAADSLTESARDFRRGLADELANLPLAGPAAIAAASGRNAQIDAAMRKLEAIGVHGATTELSSWSVFQRQNFATSVSTRGLEDLQNQARTGTIAVGATPAQIDIAAAARPDDRVIQQRQADLIQNQQLPTQAALLNDANAALGAHPSDPLAIRDAAKAAEQYAALASRLKDLRDSAGEIAPAFRQFTDAARSSLEDGLGQAISRLIDGTGSLRDAFSSMAQSIVQEWSRMQAHLLVQGLIGDAGKQQSSGQSGGLGGLIGGILSAFAGGAASGAGGGTATAAMADGGILSRATLTLAGEAGPEAFVPLRGGRIPIGMSKSGEFFAHLPKGRTIPAQLHGVRAMADGGVVGSAWAGAYRGPTHITSDGGMFQPGLRSPDPALIAAKNGGNIYVIADMQQAVKLGFIRHKDTLVDILSADAAKGGKTARTFRGLR